LKTLSKNLLIIGGISCVVLGIIGIVLPVLPTTPFLLLAAFCFARSSDRFHHWLMTNRLFGEYIRNYQEGRGIPRKTKILAIILLWLMIGVSAVFIVSIWWLKVVLIGIAIGVTIHLASKKTIETGTLPPAVLADCDEPENMI
jgi:hypothetical protein